MSSHAINVQPTSLSNYEMFSERRRRASEVSVNLSYIYNQAGGCEAEYHIALDPALRARSQLKEVGATIIELFPIGEPK